jgi:hypothetical protein
MEQQEKQKPVISNYLTYAQCAQRTLINKDFEGDAGHFGLGVATEYFELLKAIRKVDVVNIGEEIGDANWYLANHLLQNFNDTHKIWQQLTEIYFYPQHSILTLEEEILQIESLVEVYCDICKKHFAYGKMIHEYENTLGKIVVSLSSCFSSLSTKYKIQPQKFLQANIDKLYNRYPEKFDADKAMNRDLEVERTTLDKML